MAFGGILSEADVKAALDSCSGEILNVPDCLLYVCYKKMICVCVFQLLTPSSTRLSSRNAVWPARVLKK